MAQRPGTILVLVVFFWGNWAVATPTWAGQGVPDRPNLQADKELREKLDRAIGAVFPALVRIEVVTLHAQAGRLQKYPSGGSGVIITKDGHVATNHHVAGKSNRLLCRLADGEEIEAELVGTDALADIAVLRLKTESRKEPGKPLPAPAPWGDSTEVRIGDSVLAMGSPAAVSQSVTLGIVSNTQMIMPKLFWPFTFTLDGEEVGTLVRWIAHDAVIFGGNSGGPLVNMKGQVVGINEIGLGSLGGAIPSQIAKAVAEELIRRGEVRRGWLGLELQPLLKDSQGPRGVLIGGVISGSGAAQAGLKAGDILTHFNGQQVHAALPEDLPLVNALLFQAAIGQKALLKVLREGRPMAFEVIAVERGKAQGEDEEFKGWGMTVRDFTLMSALENRRSQSQGVQVFSLRPGGPCSEAKPPLAARDVITEVAGQAVAQVGDLRRISEGLTAGKSNPVAVLVSVERDQQKLMTVVKIGPEPEKEKPGLARKAWIGARIQALTRDLAEALGIKGKTGVRLTQVIPDSPADKAGLKAGDLILKLDGEAIPVAQPEETEIFQNLIRQYKAGAEVTMDILRQGKEEKVKVVLGWPPTPPGEKQRYKDTDFEFTARDLAEEDRIDLRLEATERGVLIEDVLMAGWASLAHLAIGDILLTLNNQPVPDVQTLKTLMQQVRETKAKRVLLFVRRGIHTMFIELEPDWSKTH